MSVATKSKPAVCVRWMLHRDIPEVLGIEAANFEFPWSENQFTCWLSKRNCIGMVAEYKQNVAGYMIYQVHNHRFHVLNIAVHASVQRRGIGTALIRKLQDRLSKGCRPTITLEVHESNLDAQLFYRAMGFRAVEVLRGFYVRHQEDAYLMEYRCANQQTL